MAKLLNDSQAWKSVKDTLISRGIIANTPHDISKILKEKCVEDKTSNLTAAEKIDQLIQNFEIETDTSIKSYQTKLVQFEHNTNLKIEQTLIAINLLQGEKGVIRKIINKSRIRKMKEKIRGLQNNKTKLLNNVKAAISHKENAYKKYKGQREQLIENERQNIKADILILEQTLRSPEFAGAIAELNLISLLFKLPDNFVVVNNVNLVSEYSIRFDDEWLRTAQIDHVVITPAGIFVIEAKNWSKKFSESGKYYDPYKQVKRSAYLCHKLLERIIKGVAVRSIIAHTGNIPKKTDNSYSKVLLFNEVNGYINWFKENKLSDREIKNIANYLS